MINNKTKNARISKKEIFHSEIQCIELIRIFFSSKTILMSYTKTNIFTAEDYIYRARLAEKALRYEDMLIQMRNVLDLKKKLTADERNLLVVAYKNAVTTRRTGVCMCMT
jgi:hypothetical protein